MHPGLVPGNLILVALILHVSVVGVDDGHGEVNQGVLLLNATPYPVLALDVDKLLLLVIGVGISPKRKGDVV
jgi:hypothetical protein